MQGPVETAGPAESMFIFSGPWPLKMGEGRSEMGVRGFAGGNERERVEFM